VVFTFLDYPSFSDEEIDLRLTRTIERDDEKGYVPAYVYSVFLRHGTEAIGYIDIRIGENENLYYGGHIGYRIREKFRGNGYAGKACRLIVPLALAHGMTMLRITCNPDNAASRRTIEKLGAEFMGIVAVPEYNEMYLRGETSKCIFEWYIA